MTSTLAAAEPSVSPRLGRAGQASLSAVGLHLPHRMSFEEWATAGCQLSGIVDSSAWWLGDWLVFGKAHYADCYQLAIRRAGLRYQTLRNYAWVARRFEVSRRRPKLAFQHHAEIASLPVEEQERLLDLAEQESWTTKQLRNAIRQDGDGLPACAGQQEHSRIDIPSSRLAVWRRAASCVGLDLDRWMLTILDRAATETLEE